MSNEFICCMIGTILGTLSTYFIFQNILNQKNDLIDDCKKGIQKHNYREVGLLFINRSIKNYVIQQLNSTREKYAKEKTESLIGYYIALKDVEKIITQLEKNSEDLIK